MIIITITITNILTLTLILMVMAMDTLFQEHIQRLLNGGQMTPQQGQPGDTASRRIPCSPWTKH